MYVDIHCHIIPGVDDGARNQEMSLEMLRIAAAKGTGHIIATPHYIHGNNHFSYSDVIEKCHELNRLAQGNGISLTIHPGCEAFISPELPGLFERHEINTLAGSEYILVELPMMGFPSYTDYVLFSLQLKGAVPVIAHPERCMDLWSNPDILREMVSRGIKVQINSGSITGLYGKKAMKAALKFLKMGIVHFVASDAHSDGMRNPDLSQAAARIGKKFGIRLMEDIFINNGMKVLKKAVG